MLSKSLQNLVQIAQKSPSGGPKVAPKPDPLFFRELLRNEVILEMYCSDPDELGCSKVSFEHAGSIARIPGVVRARKKGFRGVILRLPPKNRVGARP